MSGCFDRRRLRSFLVSLVLLYRCVDDDRALMIQWLVASVLLLWKSTF